MGKLKLDLLKGIEEEEKVIDTSKINNKAVNIEQKLSEETTERQVQMEPPQTDKVEKIQIAKKKSHTDKTIDKKKNEQRPSKTTNKNTEAVTDNVVEIKATEESSNQITANMITEKNYKKKCINFDISDIDRYLTAAAGVHGKSKTKYLHDLVIADMKAHPEIEALIKN